MKKIILSLIMVLTLILPITAKANTKNDVTIYMFRGNTCPHCEEAIKYLKEHQEEIPKDVKFITYEVYDNAQNNNLLKKLEENFNFEKDDIGSIPLFVVGSEHILGYSGASDLKKVFALAEEAKNSESYEDLVAKEIKDSNFKVNSISLDKLIAGPNKIVTIIVFCIFGAIVLGFGAMILFSRKN